MKITALETIRIAEFANLLWLKVHTTKGSSASARPSFSPRPSKPMSMKAWRRSCSAAIRCEIDRIAKDLVGYLGFRSTGAEMRGNSAIDIALWDVFGKVDRATDRAAARRIFPLEHPHLQHLRWHIVHAQGKRADDRRTRALRRDAHLRRSQRLSPPRRRTGGRAPDEGITAMKIWPFDHAAERTDGAYISLRRSQGGAGAVRKNSQRGRRQNGHHGRVPFDVATYCRR